MTQEDALRILKTGANVFLTGEPGSGKTHTVNAYVAWLREHGIEPAITASTGIAATHIHGMTIHAWSGIGILERLDAYELDRILGREAVVKRIQKAGVLIIDEISMLSGETLDMVDEVCRNARHRKDEAFGGLAVVLVGDFFQLPPVTGRGRTVSFAYESKAWRELNPIIAYLSEQHRQEDEKFLSILSSIRSGEFDQSDIARILSRETDPDGIDDDTPRLYTHNADVDRLNAEKLASLSGSSKTFRMEGTGSANMVEGLKRGCLSPEVLELKEGAVVMCTKNHPALGFANGTLGTVIGFEAGSHYPIIETRDGREIAIGPLEWAVEQDGKVRAKISQVPLRLAWAITIHKSQGMSLDAAAMDLSRAFEFGQGYVALSRVRKLDGISILGFTEDALLTHPSVRAQDAAFREASSEAAASFMLIEETGQRAEMEKQFIRALGGTLEAKPRDTVKGTASTYDATLALLAEGRPLREIAKARSLTLGTIGDHVEKLIAAGRFKVSQLEPLLPESVTDNRAVIEAAFLKLGKEKLAPVYTELNGICTYDELKLARALFAR